VYIGSDELADRTRALIQRWRKDAVTEDQRHQDRVMADYLRMARARGYSARASRRLEKAARKSFTDPRKALRLAIQLRRDDADIRLGKPPGRPRRSALW